MGSTMPPCPPPAREAAAAACGGAPTLRLITDRRGSAVWKATGDHGTVAIKVGYADHADRHVGREAAVIDAMGLGYRLAWGTAAEGTWLVTRWLHGPSTWRCFTGVRETPTAEGREEALRASVELSQAVGALHSLGWIHADLQPSHARHTTCGARLIDVSWSHHAAHPPADGFRGGVVHLIAPELAADIATSLRDQRPALPTPASDVYALAGTLLTCTTGRWPLDYQAVGIDPPAAGPDAVRDAIATGRIPLASAPPWPTLHALLRPALSPHPHDRPTAEELGAELEKLAT